MSKKKPLVSVKVIKGDINRALKKYKRRVNDSGHLLELRERKTYTKPTTVRRKAKQQAINLATKTVVGEIFKQSLKGASRQGVKFASVVLDEPIYEKTKTQSSWNFQILCECDRAFRFKNIMESY